MLTAEAEKGLKRGHRRSPSVVTEDEFVEIDLQMLGAHAAVGAAEPGREVRDRPICAWRGRVGVAVTFGFGRTVGMIVEALARRCARSLPLPVLPFSTPPISNSSTSESRLQSEATIAPRTICSIVHAVSYRLSASWRCNCRADIPEVRVAIRYAAQNHNRRATIGYASRPRTEGTRTPPAIDTQTDNQGMRARPRTTPGARKLIAGNPISGYT